MAGDAITAPARATGNDSTANAINRSVLDSVPAALILLEPIRDPAGTIIDFAITDANQAACDDSGLAYPDLVGQRVKEVLPHQVGSGIFTQCIGVIETGRPQVLYDFSYGVDFTAWQSRRFDIRAVAVGSGLSFSWLDVTERYEAVNALAESEQRYRMLAENAADVVYVINPAGVVTWIAPTISRALGWTADELLGTVMAELMHPEDLAKTLAARSALHEGAGSRDSEDFLVRMRTKSGEYVWAAGTGRTLRAEDGTAIGVLASGRVVQDLVEARQEAEQGRALLQAVMDAMPDPQVLLAPIRDDQGSVVDFRFEAANKAAVERVQETAGVYVIGQRVSDLVAPSLFEATFEPYRRVLESGEPLRVDDVPAGTRSTDGREHRYDIRTQRVGDLLSNTWRDVTERHLAEQALAASESRYRMLAENASDVVWAVSEDGRIEWVSESVVRVLGWQREELVGVISIELVHPEDRADALSRSQETLAGRSGAGSFRFRCADGTHRWMSVSERAVEIDGTRRLIVGLRDISGEMEARENLTYLAFHDELTGLRNRPWVLDMLDVEINTAKRDGRLIGVLFIDLDNFKVVNDSLGHTAGDAVLRDVANRIAHCMRPSDRVGRIGGDEFVVIVTDIAEPLDVELVAERISRAINEPLMIQGHTIVPTASIGIALSGPDSTPASLLRDTDAALFRAKAAGRARWQFFDQAMHVDALARLTIEAEIRLGLAERQFVVYYQPVVDLSSGSVAGHEALVRWQHPDRGLLTPCEFLPIAEDSGLVVELGDLVVRQVCEMLALHSEIPGQVSVNVSPVALSRPGWADRFIAAAQTCGVDPARLCIEITETAALTILESSQDDLRRLQQLGVGIHVDDFGTGYSSLTLLRDLPVTGLKLDLTFTQTMETDEVARVLAEGLALLAAGLHLTSIAEGLETAEQVQAVRGQGWTHGQGYLFGRPAPDPVLTTPGPAPGQEPG